MPHLSVCIPTYCQTEFISATLRSVQAQDFSDYELIISDDTPGKSVADLVRSFDFGGRLRYYRNPAVLGSPGNWNEVIRHAKGDYIKLLHHNDQLNHPGALSAFGDLLDEHPQANFAFSATHVHNTVNGQQHVHRPIKMQLARLSGMPEMLFSERL